MLNCYQVQSHVKNAINKQYAINNCLECSELYKLSRYQWLSKCSKYNEEVRKYLKYYEFTICPNPPECKDRQTIYCHIQIGQDDPFVCNAPNIIPYD